MNPHALPAGHSYYTTSATQAATVAAKHNSTVDRYSLGRADNSWGFGVLDPTKGGFILINWNTGERSYKDSVST
jgi:hypothetical protein